MLDPAIVPTQPKGAPPGQFLSPGHHAIESQQGDAGTNTFAPGQPRPGNQSNSAGGNNLDSGQLVGEAHGMNARVNTLTPVHPPCGAHSPFDRDTFAPPSLHPEPRARAAAQDLTPGQSSRATHERPAGATAQTNKGAANE